MSAPAVVGSVGDTRRPLPSKAEALARHAVNTQPSLSDSIEMAAQIFREIDDDTEAEDELDHEDEESGQEEADEDEDDVVFGAAGGNLLNLDADAWDDTALIQLWDQHVRMYKKAHGQLTAPAEEEQDESKEETNGSSHTNGEASSVNSTNRTASTRHQHPATATPHSQPEVAGSRGGSKQQRRDGSRRQESQSAAVLSPPLPTATASAPSTSETGVATQAADPWAAWYHYYYSQQQQQPQQPYPYQHPAVSTYPNGYPYLPASSANPSPPPPFASASPAAAQSPVHAAAASLARVGGSDESLAQLLTAWYYSGYYTGKYHAMQESQSQRR